MHIVPKNPESMRPTLLSRAEVVTHSNSIVIFECFRAMGEARELGDAKAYEQAQDFINGQGYETFRRNDRGKKKQD